MSAPQPLRYPVRLAQYDAPEAAGELKLLLSLQIEGITLAPTVVLPAALETSFYQLNNLPAQLNACFAKVDPGFVDEDEVEEQAPAAQQLIKSHYLLDEMIDRFYDQTADLPARLCVRRPGEAGKSALKGRPALIAVKDLWANDWSFEAVMDRLERSKSLALEARPVLVQDAAAGPANEPFQQKVQALLGEDVQAFTDPQGRLLRLVL